MAVKFALPLDVSTSDTVVGGAGTGGGITDDGETTLDNFELVDEKTSLLKAEGGSVKSPSGIDLTASGARHLTVMPSAVVEQTMSGRSTDDAPLTPGSLKMASGSERALPNIGTAKGGKLLSLVLLQSSINDTDIFVEYICDVIWKHFNYILYI